MSERNLKDTIGNAAERVDGVIAGTTQAVKAVRSRGRAAVEHAGEQAQGLAREAAQQTGAAAESLANQGKAAHDVLVRIVVENPLTSLLVAGAVGYGLAWISRRAE